MLDLILHRRPSSSVLIYGTNPKLLLAEMRHGACILLNDDRPARKVHPDYIEFDASAEHTTDAVKDWASNIEKRPFEGGRIVLGLHMADNIDVSGANALLKTLEEPPKHISILLTVAKVAKLLPTVLSRVFRVQLADKGEQFSSNELRAGLDVLQFAKTLKPGEMHRFPKEGLRASLEAAVHVSDNMSTTAQLLRHIDLLDHHVGEEQVALSLNRALHK